MVLLHPLEPVPPGCPLLPGPIPSSIVGGGAKMMQDGDRGRGSSENGEKSGKKSGKKSGGIITETTATSTDTQVLRAALVVTVEGPLVPGVRMSR